MSSQEDAVVRATETDGVAAWSAVTTPVCHLIYSESGQGTFFLQWKPDGSHTVEESLLVFVPSKQVPKFKVTQNGGKHQLSQNVLPDKKLFYSCLCQFVKTARDYNSRIYTCKGWADLLPYKSDLFVHFQSNQVSKLDESGVDTQLIDGVVAVPRGNVLPGRMAKEQLSLDCRNSGYVMLF